MGNSGLGVDCLLALRRRGEDWVEILGLVERGNPLSGIPMFYPSWIN